MSGPRPAEGAFGALPALNTSELGRNLLLLSEVDSTNRYLKDNGGELPHGTVCCTDRQTAGKGRRGREWNVPPGRSLALSVLFKPAVLTRQEGEASLLPLLCGLAAARALDRLTSSGPVPFGIKWPNDIVCSGKKLGGILCESRLDRSGGYTVAGIGINLCQTREDFRRLGLDHATSLALWRPAAPSPAQTAAAFIEELEPLWQTWRREGFGPLREEFARRCVTLGQEVRVYASLTEAGEPPLLEGTAVGIDDAGRLCVRGAADNSITAVSAGEVSVRGLYGYS